MYPLSDGMFAVRNHWYVAAWSSEVGRQPMERWILDEPVALFRKENGEAVALEGRCPHRSFPLGRSRVVGDTLQCGYHGIAFNSDGTCARIPSQSAIPSACDIKSYPLVEHWKLLWIWMGNAELADKSLLPDLTEIERVAEEYKMFGEGHTLVPARYMLLLDNLMDLTHVGYLHMVSAGGEEGNLAQNTVPKVTATDKSIEAYYLQKNVPVPDIFSVVAGFSGSVDRVQAMKLYYPGFNIGGQHLYEPSEIEGVGRLIWGEHNFHIITPATRHSTHYFFTIGQTGRQEPKENQWLFDAGMQKVIPEDASAAILIEGMIEASGGRPREVLLKADNACVTMRRMIEKMIKNDGVMSSEGVG